MNYGLLSLATTLKRNGIDVLQIQGDFQPPIETLNVATSYGIENSCFPVLVSVVSFYAVGWVNEFLAALKEVAPHLQVIVGGRWVVDGQTEHMKSLVPLADKVVSGTAEDVVLQLVTNTPKVIRSPVLKTDAYRFSLDYSILHQRNLYQPSIEVSRGCGMGCSFCQEKDEPISKLKNPKQIIDEVKYTLIEDDLTPMNFYLEASMFTPSRSWSELLALDVDESLQERFRWRAESRVDSINPKNLENLYRSGLRVIDLGLESASHRQLISMGKTKNPEKYLKKASNLVKEAWNLGIMVKLNILLFAGESLRSIAETCDWLDDHSQYITGVSVGPVIVFGWPHRVSAYLSHLAELGASPYGSGIQGVTHLHLSREIDYARSIELATEIGRRFTTEEQYFKLKSFSYFSRDYYYYDFLRDCEKVSEQLNFRRTDQFTSGVQ